MNNLQSIGYSIRPFPFSFCTFALLQFPELRTPAQSPSSQPRRVLGLEVRSLFTQIRHKGLWKHEEVRSCLRAGDEGSSVLPFNLKWLLLFCVWGMSHFRGTVSWERKDKGGCRGDRLGGPAGLSWGRAAAAAGSHRKALAAPASKPRGGCGVPGAGGTLLLLPIAHEPPQVKGSWPTAVYRVRNPGQLQRPTSTLLSERGPGWALYLQCFCIKEDVLGPPGHVAFSNLKVSDTYFLQI